MEGEDTNRRGGAAGMESEGSVDMNSHRRGSPSSRVDGGCEVVRKHPRQIL